MLDLTKKTAFTLAEVLITLVIAGLIAWPFMQAAKRSTRHYTNSLGTYSALKNLETAAYDMAQGVGCTTADIAATPTTTPTHPYCTSSTGVLPQYKHTDPAATVPNRGFCDRLANEEFNTAGTVDCTLSISSETGQFDTSHMNFQTTNGMRFFNFGAALAGQSATTTYYTVYIDIDGPKRNGSLTESVAGAKDADVVKFLVSIDGNTIVPDASSIAANDTDYLSASAWYVSGGNNVYVLSGVPYRQAACAADSNASPNPFPSVDTTYCNAKGSYSSYPRVSPCDTQTCYFDYSQPPMIWGSR